MNQPTYLRSLASLQAMSDAELLAAMDNDRRAWNAARRTDNRYLPDTPQYGSVAYWDIKRQFDRTRYQLRTRAIGCTAKCCKP